ncbi:MAG: DUF433 domain-containing protein [Nanoarchaeota archaeon]
MRKIIIDQRVRHGIPIIEGTRISVEEVLGMLTSGMTYEEIEKEYNLRKEDILIVLRYIASLIHGEEVRELQK